MSPSEMYREIATQPDCWRQVAQRPTEIRAFLAGTGGRMALLGCGTSFHVAAAVARLREGAGYGASDPFPASEVPNGRRYPWVLAISRTGTTTETIRAVEGFVEGAQRLVITAGRDSPLAKLAHRLLVLDFADERSVVQTRFATSALMAMRAHLGHPVNDLAVEGEQALTAPLPGELESSERFVFIGTGWAAALAGEAALKMTEAAGAACAWYPAMELRHGPLSALGPDTLLWSMGPVEEALREAALATGAVVAGGQRDPIAELIVVQRAAELLACRRGRDPDAPARLGRSVVLD